MTDPLSLGAASLAGVVVARAFDYLKARLASGAQGDANDLAFQRQLLKRVEHLESHASAQALTIQNLLVEKSTLLVELVKRDATIAARDASIAELTSQVHELTTDCSKLKSEVASLLARVPA